MCSRYPTQISNARAPFVSQPGHLQQQCESYSAIKVQLIPFLSQLPQCPVPNSKTPWTGEDKKSLIYISFWEIHAALQEQNCSILASGSSEEKAKTSILAYLTEATNAEPVGLAAARSSQLLSGTFMTRLKLYRVTKVGNTRWDPQADKALLLSTASPLAHATFSKCGSEILFQQLPKTGY